MISVYKTLLEIRKLKSDAEEKGLPESVIKGVEAHADSLMTKGVDDLVERLLAQYYQSKDGARRNELKIELKYSLHAIAGRIDRGFNIEVRAKPLSETPDDEPQVNDEDFATIQNARPDLEFLKAEGSPVLTLPAATTPEPTAYDEPSEKQQPDDKEKPQKKR